MKLMRTKSKVLGKQPSTSTSITCGSDNPASLGCVFYELESGEAAAPFTAQKIHEGHDGIMHGGLSAAVVDETMGRSHVVYNKKKGRDYVPVVTAEMTTNYIRPIETGKPMVAYGRIEKEDGRKRFATGEILDKDGAIMLTAKALFITVDFIEDVESTTKIHERQPLCETDPKEL